MVGTQSFMFYRNQYFIKSDFAAYRNVKDRWAMEKKEEVHFYDSHTG